MNSTIYFIIVFVIYWNLALYLCDKSFESKRTAMMVFGILMLVYATAETMIRFRMGLM